MILDVHMNIRDQTILNRVLKENQDNTIRHKLIKKYNLYYSHWIDFCILVSLIAMIGLAFGMYEWEKLYPSRGGSGELLDSSVFGEGIIAMTSGLGVLAIVLKFRMEATWRNYNNPMKFYRKMLRH